jgi:hypothetical protein
MRLSSSTVSLNRQRSICLLAIALAIGIAVVATVTLAVTSQGTANTAAPVARTSSLGAKANKDGRATRLRAGSPDGNDNNVGPALRLASSPCGDSEPAPAPRPPSKGICPLCGG